MLKGLCFRINMEPRSDRTCCVSPVCLDFIFIPVGLGAYFHSSDRFFVRGNIEYHFILDSPFGLFIFIVVVAASLSFLSFFLPQHSAQSLASESINTIKSFLACAYARSSSFP